MSVINRVGEWITNGIGAFFQSILENMINTLINVFIKNLTSVYGLANDLLNSAYVTNTIELIQGVALAILLVRIGIQAITNYILWQHGESNDAKNLLWEALSGGFMIYATPWLSKWIFNLGSVLADDIATIIGFKSDNPILDTLLFLTGGASLPLIFIAMAWVVMLILILIQASVRAVELSLLAATGPILTVRGLKADLTASWIRNVLVISLTQAVQIFLIKGMFVTMAEFTSFHDFFGLTIGLGFLWVCYRTPNVLKEYTYSTGTGQAIGGVIQQAGSMSMMQKVFTKM